MQHASVFQDSVVIIPTSSACFNSFKSGLISYKVKKIDQILKNKKKKERKKKKRNQIVCKNCLGSHTVYIM